MSTTYSLVCHDCHVKYWAGQRDYLYNVNHVALFLHEHVHHKLEFVNDLAQACETESYDDVEYKESELGD